MMRSVNRRQLLHACFAGVAATIGLLTRTTARAADPLSRNVRVGFVYSGSPESATAGVSTFWKQLQGLGWVEGRNLLGGQQVRSTDFLP